LSFSARFLLQAGNTVVEPAKTRLAFAAIVIWRFSLSDLSNLIQSLDWFAKPKPHFPSDFWLSET